MPGTAIQLYINSEVLPRYPLKYSFPLPYYTIGAVSIGYKHKGKKVGPFYQGLETENTNSGGSITEQLNG